VISFGKAEEDRYMKALLCIFAVLLIAMNVCSQDRDVTVEAVFTGPQPAAIVLPLPKYPKAAKDAGLGGRVAVEISVGADGAVSVLDQGDGPYPVCRAVTEPNVLALRLAAVNAAKKARFKRALAGESGTAAGGRLLYDFGPEPEIVEVRAAAVSGAVVTDGKPLIAISDAPVTGITGLPAISAGAVGNAKNAGIDRNTPMPKTVSGGVLNGHALALPVPSYPRAAKAVRAAGPVYVQVLIMVDGTVYSAAAVSGHPLLRQASEKAACGARFTPTLFQGQPVKVSGIITYNYNL
jgi:hypothetical protein